MRSFGWLHLTLSAGDWLLDRGGGVYVLLDDILDGCSLKQVLSLCSVQCIPGAADESGSRHRMLCCTSAGSLRRQLLSQGDTASSHHPLQYAPRVRHATPAGMSLSSETCLWTHFWWVQGTAVALIHPTSLLLTPPACRMTSCIFHGSLAPTDCEAPSPSMQTGSHSATAGWPWQLQLSSHAALLHHALHPFAELLLRWAACQPP